MIGRSPDSTHAPLAVGTQVRHSRWGTGVVVALRPGASPAATVVFGAAGEKRLLVEALERVPARAAAYSITPTPADDLAGSGRAEHWSRRIEDIRERAMGGVDATRVEGGDWPWQVEVWAMGAVRHAPLEGDLRRAIAAALQSVKGVTRAVEGDRESWVVKGNPSGEALVAAVARVLDQHEGPLRAYMALRERD